MNEKKKHFTMRGNYPVGEFEAIFPWHKIRKKARNHWPNYFIEELFEGITGDIYELIWPFRGEGIKEITNFNGNQSKKEGARMIWQFTPDYYCSFFPQKWPDEICETHKVWICHQWIRL